MVLERAVSHYGSIHQVMVAIEEMAELTKELLKHHNRGENRVLEITEEMADVQIMLWQLSVILDNGEEVNKAVESKVKRQERRMNKGR